MLKLVPQIEPVTRLARGHKEIFEMLQNGPVILAQHSKAAAVLVDVETWNETLRRLAYLERMVVAERASARIRAGQYFTQEEVDAGFRKLGLDPDDFEAHKEAAKRQGPGQPLEQE
jgi:hypothetical protein